MLKTQIKQILIEEALDDEARTLILNRLNQYPSEDLNDQEVAEIVRFIEEQAQDEQELADHYQAEQKVVDDVDAQLNALNQETNNQINQIYDEHNRQLIELIDQIKAETETNTQTSS